MKASYKFLLAAALSAPLLTGCIEESVPTQYVLSNQLVGNSNAITAFANAMPAHMNVIATIGQEYHFDAGMPSMLQIRNVMTDDMHVRYAGGFDWYSSWAVADDALGPNYLCASTRGTTTTPTFSPPTTPSRPSTPRPR